MERPKSAKHNLERYKKSAYTNYKRNNRVSNNTSSQSSYLDNSSSTNTSFYFNNINNNTIQPNDTDLISTTPIEAQFVEDNGNLTPSALRRKEQRYQTSKSAFVGSISKLRPQSARHNLEKYRQDVLLEQQRKLQKLQLLQQQQQQVLSVTPNQMQQDINQIEPNNDIENNIVNANMFGDDDDDDDIDNLDGLLIREEDSSSDLDSNHSGSNKNLADPSKTNLKKSNKIKLTAINPNNNNNNNTQQTSTSLNKKSKLLARRTGGPTNPANPTNGANNLRLSAAKEHAQHANLPNKSASFNHYTTFRPTAVTTTYSTNPLQPSNNINSILVQQQQQQQQQQQCSSSLSNYGSNVVTLHPTSSNINFDNGAEIENQHLANTTAASTATNTTTTTATNSSSSSSSSTSSKNQQLLLQQQQVVHLNENESNLNGRQKQANDITSQELLNEWYKNDDEVDLRINNNNSSSYGEMERRRVLVQQQPIIHHQSSAQQRFNPAGKQSQSQQQIILANNNGRTSRFSDYSANSNIINTKSNNQNGYVIKEKSSVMDSWTKRNPALVAQNVLLKHKAELEKLSTSRNTNNSQASNASLLTTTNKYLLPDAKYFKK